MAKIKTFAQGSGNAQQKLSQESVPHKKPGPKPDFNKIRKIHFRLSAPDMNLLLACSASSGLSPGQWCREKILSLLKG